jgi:hypothetical protein
MSEAAKAEGAACNLGNEHPELAVQSTGILAVGRLLPPHPGPLPKGEGELQPGFRMTGRFRLLEARSTARPLPKGEGWGEGEQSVEAQETLESWN